MRHIWVLNYICRGLKKVLKSIKFDFQNGAGTLICIHVGV